MNILLFLIVAVLAFLVGVLVGFGVALARTEYRTLAWMQATEATARARNNPMDSVELPGYQGIIRRYRQDFKL